MHAGTDRKQLHINISGIWLEVCKQEQAGVSDEGAAKQRKKQRHVGASCQTLGHLPHAVIRESFCQPLSRSQTVARTLTLRYGGSDFLSSCWFV